MSRHSAKQSQKMALNCGQVKIGRNTNLDFRALKGLKHGRLRKQHNGAGLIPHSARHKLANPFQKHRSSAWMTNPGR
jgi:hypothetical protein